VSEAIPTARVEIVPTRGRGGQIVPLPRYRCQCGHSGWKRQALTECPRCDTPFNFGDPGRVSLPTKVRHSDGANVVPDSVSPCCGRMFRLLPNRAGWMCDQCEKTLA